MYSVTNQQKISVSEKKTCATRKTPNQGKNVQLICSIFEKIA